MVMVAALALVGGACGGDDDGDVADDAAATSDAGDDGGDDGGDGGDGGEWCDAARDVDVEDDLLDGVDFTDPDALEDAYQRMIDVVEDAADSAPDEIKEDVELVVDRGKAVLEALQDADFNILDVDQAVFEDPEAEAASDRIDDYNERVCGIESDVDTDATDDTGVGAVDDGTDDTDGDDSDDDGLSGEGTIGEELVRQFTAMGMTEDQANCMVDNLDMEEVAASGAEDPTMFLDLFETCGIDLTDLQPGG